MALKLVRLLSALAFMTACASHAPPGAAPTAPVNLMTPADLMALPKRPADHRVAYGSDSNQFGELRVPTGAGPHPVVVLVHGGCWRADYADLAAFAPMADALKEAGVASWNIEYRRLGQAGGGWPGTYQDVGAAIDRLRAIAGDHHLDLNRVVVVGHSAGGHLAHWSAARARIRQDSPLHATHPLLLRGVVNLAGMIDMRENIAHYETECRDDVIHAMLGGAPSDVPERYADASAPAMLPLGTPQTLVWGEHEKFVPAPLAEAYVRAARQAGDSVRLVTVPGVGHFESASPSSPAWPHVKSAIDTLLGPSRTTPVAAPSGAESLDVHWGMFDAPGVGAILTAIARPEGDGPFPAVIILHGSHGFAREYVQLAKDLSHDGVLAIAACWFAPGSGAGSRFVTPVSCPAEAPPMSSHLSPQSVQTIDALVRAVRALPDVRADQIALFGHSRGGGAAWNHVLQGGDVQAVILNSAGYPDEIVRRAAEIDAPVLILHGDADSPADGGGPITDVSRARAFESALRRSGKSVEAVYYPGGRHNGLFDSPSQYDAEVRRMRIFLRRHFRR